MTTTKPQQVENSRASSALVKLTEKLAELHAQEGEILAEMAALLSGQPGVASLMKAFEAAFDEVWCLRYAPGRSKQYLWQYVKDRPQIKRLLKTLPMEELTARVARYLANDDPFFVRARHPFGLFVSTVNQHAAESRAPFELDAPVIDCRHLPPCSSDQQHTSRIVADSRR